MTFNPDDPELISLIAQCRNDRDAVPPLADWLEEHGFDRDKHNSKLMNQWYNIHPPDYSVTVGFLALWVELKRRSVANDPITLAQIPAPLPAPTQSPASASSPDVSRS